MYERLFITFAVMAFGLSVMLFIKRRQITSANRVSQQLSKSSQIPTIVYFWSQGCHVCKSTQMPILEKIITEYGKEQVALTKYNIDEAPDVAKEWGVRTLPTTFLVDSTGTTRHVNNGLVASGNLRKQLEPILLQQHGR